jgi:superfamily I DNA/RNA helicase
LLLAFRLRGISSGEESTVKARKIEAEQSAFIKRLRSRMEVAGSLEDIQTMIGSILEFIGKEAFCRIHEQYLQTSFLQQTASACARALVDARRKTHSWAQALDDFLGIDTVPIMTIHKSKGLEYHTVVFIGLEDYPIKYLSRILPS